MQASGVMVEMLVRREAGQWLAFTMIDEQPSLGVAQSEPGAIWMSLRPYAALREALFRSLPSLLLSERLITALLAAEALAAQSAPRATPDDRAAGRAASTNLGSAANPARRL
jgi:hypothetical protein